MSVNVFELSDEELLQMDLDALEQKYTDPNNAASTEPTEEAQTETTEQDERTDTAASTDDASEAQGEASAEGEAESNEAEPVDSGEAEPSSDPTAEGTPVPEKNVEAVKEAPKEEPEKESTAAVNYEGEYKKLLAPFAANGREMSVKNVEEAITLMQMGANYNKKMAALKPNLKLIKLLETNNLLSEEKLGYLIDLANKDTGAINKLVKDSGLDPMDLNAEKAEEYRPKQRAVHDKELELDSVLEDIKDTPSYQRTLKAVGTEWDEASRQVIVENPQLLKVINLHVQNGVYDMIEAEVNRERTFGRLQGMSHIEAYRQVGDAIQARGGFDQLTATRSSQGQQDPTRDPVVVQPKPKQEDERLKEKRRAASPAKPSASASVPSNEPNYLALSDDEFMKMARPR